MFLQMSCNTSHSCCRFTRALFTFSFFMYIHTCSMMFMSGLWAGQFRTVKLPSRFLFSRYFLITLAVCLESLSCWKTKLLPIRAFPTGTAWWVIISLYFGAVRLSVILYRCPTPLSVIEPQTCRDPPPCFTVRTIPSDLHLSPLWRRTY